MVTDLIISSKEDNKMKRSIKIIAVALVAVMLCGALISCGLFGKKLNGTYESSTGVTLEFKGSKVELTYKDWDDLLYGSRTTYEGTYKIEDDTITFEFVDADGEVMEDFKYNKTFDFEEKENGDIYIGNTEYEITD